MVWLVRYTSHADCAPCSGAHNRVMSGESPILDYFIFAMHLHINALYVWVAISVGLNGLTGVGILIFHFLIF